MKKELTPLKAFRRFRDNIRWLEENTPLKLYFENNELHLKEDLDIIETALEDYEALKREYEFGVEHYNELLNEYVKEHNALEIIKEKGTLFFVDDEGNPNTTEEERKILKELFKEELL